MDPQLAQQLMNAYFLQQMQAMFTAAVENVQKLQTEMSSTLLSQISQTTHHVQSSSSPPPTRQSIDEQPTSSSSPQVAGIATATVNSPAHCTINNFGRRSLSVKTEPSVDDDEEIAALQIEEMPALQVEDEQPTTSSATLPTFISTPTPTEESTNIAWSALQAQINAIMQSPTFFDIPDSGFRPCNTVTANNRSNNKGNAKAHKESTHHTSSGNVGLESPKSSQTASGGGGGVGEDTEKGEGGGKTKGYECPICHKILARRWYLNSGHMRVHTGAKPFNCDSCGRAFSDKSNKRQHEKICARLQGDDGTLQ